jgi:hypothetical protein
VPLSIILQQWCGAVDAESVRERVRWVSAIWYVSLMSAILLAHDMFREVLNCSVTAPDRPETQPPMRVQAPTPVPLSLVCVLPRSFHRWTPCPIYPISSLFWGLAGHGLGNRRCAPALLMMARSPIKPSPIQETRR